MDHMKLSLYYMQKELRELREGESQGSPIDLPRSAAAMIPNQIILLKELSFMGQTLSFFSAIADGKD